MRNRIAFKLNKYFVTALLVFSLMIGGVFIILFRDHTVGIYKSELEKRAKNIAQALVTLLEDDGMGRGQGQSSAAGYRSYIKFINEIAMTDVWIVDQDLELIMPSQGQGMNYTYADLPENADSIVEDAMSGMTAFSESFSSLFEDPVITVGVPIILTGGETGGVVLLHSPVDGITDAVYRGLVILGLSILVSLFISMAVSASFSSRFTKPLKIMDDNARKLANGEYSVKNGIDLDDEIGDLADQLDILADSLYTAARNSEKLEDLRKAFVANISHELKTPITVIRGSLEALLDGVVTDQEKTREYYLQMLKESIGLQRLVGDLLDLSRLQNTDFALDMDNVDISVILKDAVSSAENIAPEKKIRFILDIDSEADIMQGDQHRLKQMFMTVLDNALRFSPEGGRITVCLKRDDRLLIKIRDEGPGIDEDDIPYIFDRFYKTKQAGGQGTGLGLAIANQIAKRHDIKISARNNEAGGAEFIFEFKGHKTEGTL